MRQNRNKLPDVDTIVVPFDELVGALRFNEEYTGREYADLRISPPFEGDVEASRFVTADKYYYPPELDPPPRHYKPCVFCEGKGGCPKPPLGMLDRSHAAREMDSENPSEDAIDRVQQIHEKVWKEDLKKELDESPDVFADDVDVEYVFDNGEQ